MRRRTLLLLVPLTLAALAHNGPTRIEPFAPSAVLQTTADTSFARLIATLSEPGGFFDSDNLISNEASYLHVMGALRRTGVKGGAYIGVGPDQNFSYIAEIQPEVAFIVDIRRDNLLHHLLFKALFANARNRVEYLCLLFGKPAPRDLNRWHESTVEQIAEYVDVIPAEEEQFEDAADRVRATVESFGVQLDENDYATIRRFHSAFYQAGLDLRFTSRGRATRRYYPTYRMLLLETDLEGQQANFLASEERFGVIKRLEQEGRIIPVVGDLAGEHALAAIGDEIARRGMVVSAFYTSNVEYYLMLDGTFDQFASTVAQSLPFDNSSVMIRSYFSRGMPHPQNMNGYYATQLVEPLHTFVAEHKGGGYHSYADLVTKNILPVR
jgi:hypothetical protein